MTKGEERVGILIKVYPVAELFFAPGGPLRVLSTLLFMEEPRSIFLFDLESSGTPIG